MLDVGAGPTLQLTPEGKLIGRGKFRSRGDKTNLLADPDIVDNIDPNWDGNPDDPWPDDLLDDASKILAIKAENEHLKKTVARLENTLSTLQQQTAEHLIALRQAAAQQAVLSAAGDTFLTTHTFPDTHVSDKTDIS